jgi:hypothetical protein
MQRPEQHSESDAHWSAIPRQVNPPHEGDAHCLQSFPRQTEPIGHAVAASQVNSTPASEDGAESLGAESLGAASSGASAPVSVASGDAGPSEGAASTDDASVDVSGDTSDVPSFDASTVASGSSGASS